VPSTKKAIALQYDKSALGAPKVLAKGKGTIAESIIKKAEEFDIALFKNPELATSLIELDINQEIPPKLYQAVADVFIWLMKNEKRND